MLRQLVIPPQLTKSLRCTVTPGPDLGITEVGIPEHIYYRHFKDFARDTYNLATLIKRDPVINRGSYIVGEVVVPVKGSCVMLNPLWFSHMNMDIDGDCANMQLINSRRATIESNMNMNPHMSMYKPNNTTALVFTEQHILKMMDVKNLKTKIYDYIFQIEKRKNKT